MNSNNKQNIKINYTKKNISRNNKKRDGNAIIIIIIIKNYNLKRKKEKVRKYFIIKTHRNKLVVK
jgi:hypothetical protein